LTAVRAAVLHEIPGDLAIEDVTIDGPGPGEVLVRTVAAGLCHSDLHTMRGVLPRPVPAVLGHEAAGIVEEVGPGVVDVRPGDHVICCLTVFCGRCERCLSGETWLCSERASTARAEDAPARLSLRGRPLYQYANLGAFAERMLVHHNAVVPITPEMPLDRAALLGCAVLTGLGAAQNTAGVRAGDRVVLIGCGGIGLNVLQGARLAGATRIVAVDVSSEALDLARRFGATATVHVAEDAPPEAVVEAVLDELGGGGDGAVLGTVPGEHGADHAFEAIGSPATVRLALDVVRPGGSAYVIGVLPAGSSVEVPAEAFLQAKSLHGVYMGSSRFKVDLPRLVDSYLRGRLLLDELITGRITLDEINEGYAALEAGAPGRAVVVFDDPAG
jgi:S-(hydroxymethyl)glutathione dehydrogenase/alcohol dehydrogenase